MTNRYLLGPVTREFADRNLPRERSSGDCLTFGPDADLRVGPADSWAGVAARLPAGLAGLGDRYRVVIRTGVFGAEYRALLRRAKVVFNRSARGECNRRALEAPAAGAVLLQEAENREVPLYLDPGAEYVPYAAAD